MDSVVKGAPGEIIEISKEGIIVATAEGAVLLVEVQPENRKRMTAVEFARGRRITVGMRFGNSQS